MLPELVIQSVKCVLSQLLPSVISCSIQCMFFFINVPGYLHRILGKEFLLSFVLSLKSVQTDAKYYLMS
jgi:hypothetical protein